MSAGPSADHLGSLLSAISSKNTYQANMLTASTLAAPHYVSSYAPVGKEATHFWEIDFPLAASLAGDLLLMPSKRILDNITSGELEETLFDAYIEVSNMLGTALNGPGKERLVLQSVKLDTASRRVADSVTSYQVRSGAGGPWRVNLAQV